MLVHVVNIRVMTSVCLDVVVLIAAGCEPSLFWVWFALGPTYHWLMAAICHHVHSGVEG